MNRWLRALRPWLAVAALVAGVAVLGGLSQRYSVDTAVAASGELQLGEASRRLLQRFDEPVQVTAFIGDDAALREHVTRLLSAYRSVKSDLRFQVVDPKARPELVRELAVTRRGEVVVEYRGQREHAMAPTQARISAALERLLFQGEPYVAYTTGHGERDLLGIANFDLGHFGRRLQRKGYRLQPWQLDSGRPVPGNAKLLVVAGPRSPITAGEKQRLAAYLDRGGALLWLTEPSREADISALTELLGVRREPGVVTDPTARKLLAVDDPRLVLLNVEQQHQTVSTGEAPVLLPRVAALNVSPPPDWQAIELLQAGQQARLAALPWQDGGDRAAGRATAGMPLALGLSRSAAAADGTRRQRVVVVGDGDFLSNSYLGNAGNLPFGLNLVRWLMADDTLTATYQPAAPDQRLDFSRTGQAVIGLGFLLVLPLLLAALGGWRWWRLRRG